ncbi:MAG: dynamin-like GTPase mgm1 [Watsoniomyces obsoletus]|nr:MAG: dynamin-like GTPase mgm1 [Watsoniomyces obsoletus]
MNRRIASLTPSLKTSRPSASHVLRKPFGGQRSTAGGLLRPEDARATRRRPWPFGTSSLHNAPAVRSISFARSLPKIVLKAARLPALFGGGMIAGLAYIQYQATQAGNYAIEVFKQAGDKASYAAGGAWTNIRDAAEQTKRGWESTTEGIGMPQWLQGFHKPGEEPASEGQGGLSGSNGSPKQGRSTAAAAAVAASASALGLSQDGEDDDTRSMGQSAKDDQMMILTKKMIEIRSILQTVGQSDALTLPSIVVIGSQSSGKTSVLEAIVGHEFLPKGSNMVTRRPIELTLINTPEATSEYGVFPSLGLGKLTDFTQIQRTLTDLNLAVPEADCISDEPIQLSIYSPNVPDLSLIDLPGYIQVTGLNQPMELKQKIADLCDRYIQPPNVILAISAADVDLANSTALRASRRVDPRGERTIGVITKLDLVDPQRAVQILTDRKYPLRLGYVGVVCRVPNTTGGLFSKGSANLTDAISKNERAYFSAHPLEFGAQAEVDVGVTTLRTKLMRVLEQTMASSLASTSDAVHQELEEAIYEFKVQYNDRPLSAESYLAESLDAFKHAYKAFTERFGRAQVRELLKREIDQRVLDILAQRYWNKPMTDLDAPVLETDSLSELPKADPESLYWHRKLDASTSSLTKLGIGRLATTVVANALQSQIERLLADSTFAHHPQAGQAIRDAASGILNDRFYSTSDQVENCIKPYKFEIDVDDIEWTRGRDNGAKLLKDELKACETAFKEVEAQVGGKKKLGDVIGFVDRVRKGEVVVEGNGRGGAGGFSASLLEKAREGVFLRDRADILKMRLQAIKAKQCSTKVNKYFCPEVFLDVVADKLTSTAVLFLNVELLSEFHYQFPRELDARLGRHLSDADVERFAREDPKVRRHLDLIRRKELLELALEKMESLKKLDTLERRGGGSSSSRQSLSSSGGMSSSTTSTKDHKSTRWSLLR